MPEVVVQSLLSQISIYCADCIGLHEFSIDEMRMLIWVLQAESIDVHPSTEEPYCLVEVLRWAHDGEMYREHIEAMSACQVYAGGIECPNHTMTTGPHHALECHYYDEEE